MPRSSPRNVLEGRCEIRNPSLPTRWGVGLCEYVQHLSLLDYIWVSGSLESRLIEYVDHLHEHFLDPIHIKDGRYMPPSRPGYSIEMKGESVDAYRYSDGSARK